MRNNFSKLVVVAVFLAILGARVRAQDLKAPITPLRVQVVISKFQADKKVSSLPYTLTVNANDPRNNRANLRMGAQVPIVTMVRPQADGPSVPTTVYKDVGTNIDCAANSVEEGRFKLEITVEDSSVFTEGSVSQATMRPGEHPTLRSFRSSNTLMLKDGQSAQFTTATDKVSGEVIKVDVTLTVIK